VVEHQGRDLAEAGGDPAVIAYLDTNVIIRHLTGDPPELAEVATALLADVERLVLVDVIVAECVYVLESFYEHPREQIATAMRALLALPAVAVEDHDRLLRALELYEQARLDFAEAYLAACAELTSVRNVASFDHSLDRLESITRVETTS
jgi:predicted nucleic-acid-binding protein